MQVVTDTSAMVSLGVVANRTPNPLDCVLTDHDLFVPTRVLEELGETAAYDDASRRTATAALGRRDQFVVPDVELDEDSHWTMVRTQQSASRATSTRHSSAVTNSTNWRSSTRH